MVHYAGGIQGFSFAKHDAESRLKPYDSEQWKTKGYGVDVEFYALTESIPLSLLKNIQGFFTNLESHSKKDGPFDKNNNVKQGYLFPFSLAMLVDIQAHISSSFPASVRRCLRGLEATQDSTSSSTDNTPDSMDSHEPTHKPALPTNKIFYGPPGTGKTYHLQANLLGKYQSKTSELSREELLDQFAAKITWAEACVLALLELEKANVLDLLQHEIILSKARVSTSKRPYQTLSTTLLEHVPESCEFVNVKTRRTNSYFWKNGEGKNAFFTLYDGIEFAEFESLRNEMDSHLKAQQQNAHGAVSNHFEFVTFHQSFSYEDFVEGIKPVMEDDGDGELKYQIEPGVFKTICNTARRNTGQRYAIFIDEINRGTVASIFGELITLIEPDKREGQANELSVRLPYSKEEFSVPSNLDIYGTMNTADRSVEALDTALRRRFEFEEIGPHWKAFQDKVCEGINLGDLLCTINQRIEHLLDKDHCIGHSYFYKVTDFPSLQQVFAKNILPLLQEYFYGDFGKVGLILGNAFVQVRNERQSSFAHFDHPDADLLQEKVVYDLKDPTAVEAEGYFAIYTKANA
jgi:5-methylcytosine-specific restriction protein B